MKESSFNIGPFAAFLLITWLTPTCSFGQQLPSGVHNQLEYDSNPNGIGVRSILSGNTRDLEKFEVYRFSGNLRTTSINSNDQEQLIIITDGTVNLTINEKTRVVGKGSIAWIGANDKLDLSYHDKEFISYYLFKFKSHLPINKERGKKSGSFIIDWKDVEAKPTEKGMRRNFFDLPTGMFERFEMHVTTLNKKNEISHPPHTHRAEEVLLLLNGNVEMQMGEEFKKANPGALIFLASESSHALKNIGDEPCTYFAFQWQETK